LLQENIQHVPYTICIRSITLVSVL